MNNQMNLNESYENEINRLRNDIRENKELSLVQINFLKQLSEALCELKESDVDWSKTKYIIKRKINYGFVEIFNINSEMLNKLPELIRERLLLLSDNLIESIYLEVSQDLEDVYSQDWISPHNLSSEGVYEYPKINFMVNVNKEEISVFEVNKNMAWVLFGGMNNTLCERLLARRFIILPDLCNNEIFIENGKKFLMKYSNVFVEFFNRLFQKADINRIDITTLFYKTRTHKIYALRNGNFQVIAGYVDPAKYFENIMVNFNNDDYERSGSVIVNNDVYLTVSMGWKKILEDGDYAPYSTYDLSTCGTYNKNDTKEWNKPFYKFYLLQDFLYTAIDEIET